MTIGDIVELYAFDAWATNRTLEAAAELADESFRKDLGSSFGGVYGTAVHYIAADWVWLDRWREAAQPRWLKESDLPDLAAIRKSATMCQNETGAFLRTLTDDDVSRWFSYADVRGNHYRDIMRYSLVHKVNHASYHRGQITTLMRQLGAKPVGTDLIVWRREMLKSERA